MGDDPKPYHHGNLGAALIAATVAIIEERGVEHVSVREAAKRAGVSPAAPFRHFRSKAALLTAVAEQAMERLVEAVRQAQDAASDPDPLARLEQIGRGYLNWALAYPTHFQIVSSRSLIDFEGSDRLRQLNASIRTHMVALLMEARDRGRIAPDVDIDTVVLSSRAFVYGLARMFADGHFPEWQAEGDPVELMERALADFIARLGTGHAAPGAVAARGGGKGKGPQAKAP
jgi:AcrR family transcriptional regulator